MCRNRFVLCYVMRLSAVCGLRGALEISDLQKAQVRQSTSMTSDAQNAHVQAKWSQSHTEVKAMDNGPDIDQETLPKLFTRFFTRSESGTGLGLSFQNSLWTFTQGSSGLKIIMEFRVLHSFSHYRFRKRARARKKKKFAGQSRIIQWGYEGRVSYTCFKTNRSKCE